MFSKLIKKSGNILLRLRCSYWSMVYGSLFPRFCLVFLFAFLYLYNHTVVFVTYCNIKPFVTWATIRVHRPELIVWNWKFSNVYYITYIWTARFWLLKLKKSELALWNQPLFAFTPLNLHVHTCRCCVIFVKFCFS